MLRENSKSFITALKILGIMLSLLSFFMAFWIRDNFFTSKLLFSVQYYIVALLIIPIWFIFISAFNISISFRTKSYSAIFVEYFKCVSLSSLVLFGFIFLFKLKDISRIVILLFAVFDCIFLYLSNIIIYNLFKHYRKVGLNLRYIAIYAGDDTLDLLKDLTHPNSFGFKIKCIMSDSELIKNQFKDYTILPLNENIDNILDEYNIDEVIYAIRGLDSNLLKSLIYSCEEVGVVFRFRADFFSTIATKAELDILFSTPYLKFVSTPTSYMMLKIKQMFDYLFSFIIIICTLPLQICIAILIKLDSPGPVFFRQTRIGLRGREFTMYKFRTMSENAESLKNSLMSKNEQEGPVFKLKNDPRITKIGKILRKTSLDELPQFYNVLQGTMSVVGPRPPLANEVDKYVRWQKRRLSMKPGLTCIWQVSGRNHISFKRWMELDLEYIDNWSLKLDFILILKTIKVIFSQDGAY